MWAKFVSSARHENDGSVASRVLEGAVSPGGRELWLVLLQVLATPQVHVLVQGQLLEVLLGAHSGVTVDLWNEIINHCTF